MVKRDLIPQGAELIESGVRYRVWAPEHSRVEVRISGADSGPERLLTLAVDAAGYFHGIDAFGRAGDEYKYHLDAGGGLPDPASRWQRQGVHGPSTVIDPHDYRWKEAAWHPPSMRDLVIYELHIGTFTREGTFIAAIDRLPYLRELGISAIEIMPVADFPGDRNWGYDGVALYAPSRAYGHPDDLRALVDAAHGHGIAVILDVVYNHLGPDGNYLGAYTSRYFNPAHHTPWGAALNFDGESSGPVRAFFLANIACWMEEFHIDGFRLDATHAIIDDSPSHILAEIAAAVHQRGGFVMAEDARNESRLLLSPHENGFGLDGVWADDFHHVARVALTGEREGYYRDYKGDPSELADVLDHGWLYRGQYSAASKAKRGTECRHLSPKKFILCISNHDQVGNRAFGERLGQLVSPAQYRAASALLLLLPYTPFLFMGQEWNSSSPFLFFTDHNAQLGPLVTAGRRKEFESFEAFRDPKVRENIPDPQSLETFEKSKLLWDEPDREPHARTLALYRALLAFRNRNPAFRPEHREHWRIENLKSQIGALRIDSGAESWLILFDLAGGKESGLRGEEFCKLPPGSGWIPRLSTEESRFGGSGNPPYDSAKERLFFQQPQVLVMKSSGHSSLD